MPGLQADLDAWLDQVREEVIEPQRSTIDPHHQLRKNRFERDYLLPELRSDRSSGHNIVKNMRCSMAGLRKSIPCKIIRAALAAQP